MKKLALLLCLVLLLTACRFPIPAEPAAESRAAESTHARPLESAEPSTEESAAPTEAPDALSQIRERMSEVSSSRVEDLYMDLAAYGFKRVLQNEYAQDGSFHFVMDSHYWDHTTGRDEESVQEYYYQYEDGVFVCYLRSDGAAPSRMPMSKRDVAELDASKDLILGQQALFPDYLTDFTDEGTDSDTGLHRYTFRLRLTDVLTDQTYLCSYLSVVCNLSGYVYRPSDNLSVTAVLLTDDAMRPVKLTHDFSELKPYVLSEGAMSGEAAFDSDFMHLTYDFDYDAPETIPVPADFIP